MKKQLNLGKATLLVEKLIKDTEENNLKWEKTVLETAKPGEKKAGKKARKNYVFTANVDETMTANVQNDGEIVKVWMERNGERVYIQDELYGESPAMLTLVSKLHDLVRFYSDIQIMKEIDKYIDVPFDKNAYLIDEEK